MTATGNNYGEALFMLSREENVTDEIYKSLKTVESVFDENPEYLVFLSTPAIPEEERIAALQQAFEGKINDYVLSFLQILCKHKKSESFFECVKEFERLREFESRSAVAVVKSAVELTDLQKQKLTKNLETQIGKHVLLKCVTDASVIGGITVEVDGKIIDGSIKNNLKRAREVIVV